MFVFVSVVFNTGSVSLAVATNFKTTSYEVAPDVEPNAPLHISDVDAFCEYEFDKACAKEHLEKLEEEQGGKKQKILQEQAKQKAQQDAQKQQIDQNGEDPQVDPENANDSKTPDRSGLVRADSAVAAVQVYLNDTYGSIESFDEIPVTGVTGWKTIYGLIEGLQYELGIDYLVQSFGPTTQSYYEQKLGSLNASFSGINGATENARGSAKRIFLLIQGALLAKGYDPGSYTMESIAARNVFGGVLAMTTDAGLGELDYVNLKIAKGLFSMDQYRVIKGGKLYMQQVQQDLNRRYVFSHDSFDIIPTDGFYSRNVSTGLIYALQFELDFGDDEATGFIGNGTKSRLKEQANFGVGEKDTGKYFVHLFKAALAFNEYPCTYSGSFTDEDLEDVKDLQKFYQLSTTGTANYQTWMALLISTGDSDREAGACDVSVRLDEYKINKLKELGCKTVGRYLSNTEGATTLLDKQMTLDEFKLITSSGMSVFPIMQEWNHREQDMTYENGFEQGEKASRRAGELGFLVGTVVYFAVDLDLMEYEAQTMAVDFFKGINAGIEQGTLDGGLYITPGIYSSRNTCDIVVSENLAHSSFISDMSTGYSGNLGFALPKSWSYDQIQEVTIDAGLSTEFQVDRNVMRDGLAPSYEYADTAEKDNADTWRFLESVQWEATLDHPDNQQAVNLEVATYFRCAVYSRFEWYALLFTSCTEYSAFIKRINAKVLDGSIATQKAEQIETESGTMYAPVFYDKASGKTLDFAHLFAAMCGYLRTGKIRYHDDSTIPSREDFAGWAGDLTTFALDYVNREEKDQSMNEQQFTETYFGGNEYEFPAEDLIQDFDAINIVSETLRTNAPLSDIVISYYATVTNSYRWNNAIKERFEKEGNVYLTFMNALNPSLTDDLVYIGILEAFEEYKSYPIKPTSDEKIAIAKFAFEKLLRIVNGVIII
ncbi:MAG: DUF1906 domain-containing protein [Candidatus Ancillula sp.]|nr:DUF1906 domain-containing protein [Candidatus Ancillula sp.]